jgi:hypothetical protein
VIRQKNFRRLVLPATRTILARTHSPQPGVQGLPAAISRGPVLLGPTSQLSLARSPTAHVFFLTFCVVFLGVVTHAISLCSKSNICGASSSSVCFAHDGSCVLQLKCGFSMLALWSHAARSLTKTGVWFSGIIPL